MYTFGPVPSRRLGRSLGVSPIPAKTCSYTCVYCQLGRTDHLQTARVSFFPRDEILAEIMQWAGQSDIDYITFVGDGEPTLCADLGWLIDRTRDGVALPVAVITNGSLLWSQEVRRDLMRADVVIPTLDAGNETTFKRINRPHRNISFNSMLQGQIDFRREYGGKFWLEVMLVSGVNDSTEELTSIRRAVDKIQPDRVYLLTPIRPPAESWVKPPNPERFIEAQNIIGGAIGMAELESGKFGLQEFRNAEEAIMEIGSRHPLRIDQAKSMEAHFSEPGTVEQLLTMQWLVRVEYEGKEYLLPARFVRAP